MGDYTGVYYAVGVIYAGGYLEFRLYGSYGFSIGVKSLTMCFGARRFTNPMP